MKIVYDEDIQNILTYRDCIRVLEDLIRSKLENNVIHPPRDFFPTQKGAMVLTRGELIKEKVAGFRLYGRPKSTQITVTMDTFTGEFKGLIIGNLIGVYRTACLNAVAINYLSRPDSRVLGVIGSGFQARHHALAALEVRDIDEILVYSRTKQEQDDFIQYVSQKSGRSNLNIISAGLPNEVVEHCDILICATNSPNPILKTESVKKGLHINNVGPKYKNNHELPESIYQLADIITTDSVMQLYDESGLGPVCFVPELPHENVLGLEHYMSDFVRNPELITLFCSMGLGRTEVALANWLLETIQ